MEYVKAKEILPEALLEEIQRYVQGELIYIPARSDERRKWGESSGAADYYRTRNQEIRQAFRAGTDSWRLAETFGLSVDSIKRIIYSRS